MRMNRNCFTCSFYHTIFKRAVNGTIICFEKQYLSKFYLTESEHEQLVGMQLIVTFVKLL